MLTLNVVEMNVMIRLMISMVDVQVIKPTMKATRPVDASEVIKDTIFIAMIATYIVNTSGEMTRTTLTRSSLNKTNSLNCINL